MTLLLLDKQFNYLTTPSVRAQSGSPVREFGRIVAADKERLCRSLVRAYI